MKPKRKMGNSNNKFEGEFVFKGVKISIDNAINHFEAGEILAGKDKFGLATSHIILAAEECAKSMMLFVKYNLSNLDTSEMPDVMKKSIPILKDYDYKKMFYSHRPKQELATFISFFGELLSRLYPIPISVIDDIIFEEKEFTEEEIEKTKQIKEERLKIVDEWKRTGEIPDLGLEKISNWWEEANQRKNRGFYVDIENGKWKKPQDFTKEDYKKAYDYVSGIIVYMDRIIEMQKEYNSIDTDYE